MKHTATTPARKPYDWRKPSRTPATSRKLQAIWAAMLKRKGTWPAAAIAKETGAHVRFVRSYVAALRSAGYLDEPVKLIAGHKPAEYRVSLFYRGDDAPQMAGGSGGGKGLGNGWNVSPAAAAADVARSSNDTAPARSRTSSSSTMTPRPAGKTAEKKKVRPWRPGPASSFAKSLRAKAEKRAKQKKGRRT